VKTTKIDLDDISRLTVYYAGNLDYVEDIYQDQLFRDVLRCLLKVYGLHFDGLQWVKLFYVSVDFENLFEELNGLSSVYKNFLIHERMHSLLV
jgi:hypothetical protein